MLNRRQHRPLWQLVVVALTTALTFAGLVAFQANADSSPAARHVRFGVSMNLSATLVRPGTPVVATGHVRDTQAVGRRILFMAWNGVHFAPIARGVVAADRSYRLSGVVRDNTVVLVKLRKRYHIRRAGYSNREVVHVTSAVVSPPTTGGPTATATETSTATATADPTHCGCHSSPPPCPTITLLDRSSGEGIGDDCDPPVLPTCLELYKHALVFPTGLPDPCPPTIEPPTKSPCGCETTPPAATGCPTITLVPKVGITSELQSSCPTVPTETVTVTPEPTETITVSQIPAKTTGSPAGTK